MARGVMMSRVIAAIPDAMKDPLPQLQINTVMLAFSIMERNPIAALAFGDRATFLEGFCKLMARPHAERYFQTEAVNL